MQVVNKIGHALHDLDPVFYIFHVRISVRIWRTFSV